ncbi:mediator of RNA polymerase II transcription subunit 24-like isoform X2 [Clytia hemisphaerica]|uniref:mediator of RNA polymerase II transcription subunit 24-like isoform X1 n=1 Tax=Clytia hemisphaerica TaxID=252671 RepID=UPI0034D53DA6
MATKINTLIVDLWREKIDIFGLKRKIKENQDEISVDKLIEMVVHAVYNGHTTQGVKHLKQGIDIGVFSPIIVIDNITKLPLGKKIKCFSSALSVLDNCTTSTRHDSGDFYFRSICKAISRATIWVLENTIEVYQMLYNALSNELMHPDPETFLDVIEKSQKFLNKLICDSFYQDLNFIGKLSFADEYPSLQNHVNEILSLQYDRINQNQLFSKYESNLKELVTLMTRFLDTSTTFANYQQLPGESPSQEIFTFLQFQTLEYICLPASKQTDILDTWLKMENLNVNQLVIDLVKFSIHNILVHKNSSHLEQMMFIGYFLIKLPSIVCDLNSRYPGQTSNALAFNVCQQIAKLDFENVNSVISANGYQKFVNACHINRCLDSSQSELLLNSYITLGNVVESDSSLLSKLHIGMSKQNDLLMKLALTGDENREIFSQEMSALLSSTEILQILVAIACTDNMKSLIQSLMRINSAAERCPVGQPDVDADQRSDLFNNSFLLLTYIGTIFGDQVFVESFSTNDSSFFTTWHKNCTKITSRKMYTQTSMDTMLEPIPSSHNPQNNNAQWDEYCWSSGMIVKELTQAHLRRHISTDDLQKICEGFKNKKPALCICAMTWLCSQYKTMPVLERGRAVKIINLFMRPSKIIPLNTILIKYSMPLEIDLQSAAMKNKTVSQEQPQTANEAFTTLLQQISGQKDGVKVHINMEVLKKARKWYIDYGLSSFTEHIVKLILQSGKEEECRLNGGICICLILLDPLFILKDLFTRVLKNFFHCPKTSKIFLNPQGLCLARCISKAFAIALSIYDVSSIDALNPRPAKSIKLSKPQKSQREQLMDHYVCFLEEAIFIFQTKKKNAVSNFTLNLIEQISMALSLSRTPVTIDESVAMKLLDCLPSGVSRGTITMLCNLSTINGQEAAAKVFYLQASKMHES